MIPFDAKEVTVEDVSFDEAKQMIEHFLASGYLSGLSQVQGRSNIEQLLNYTLASFNLDTWAQQQSSRDEVKFRKKKRRLEEKFSEVQEDVVQLDNVNVGAEEGVANEVAENEEEIAL